MMFSMIVMPSYSELNSPSRHYDMENSKNKQNATISQVMALRGLMTYINAPNTGNVVLEAQACQARHPYQCCKVEAEMYLQTNPKANLGSYTKNLSMRSTILSTLVKQTENSKLLCYK
jgi:hypothetical protein